MSKVIKRRGDEGHRGKERWRTEGDVGGGGRWGQNEEGTGMSSVFITPDWILPKNIFYGIKCLSYFWIKVYF